LNRNGKQSTSPRIGKTESLPPPTSAEDRLDQGARQGSESLVSWKVL